MLEHLSENGINFLVHLVNKEGNFKTWNFIKDEYNLSENFYFHWMQLVSTIPRKWKESLKNNLQNSIQLVAFNHHVTFNSRVLSIEKLNSKEIYLILIHNLKNKPTSQSYFENIFTSVTLDWKLIYILPRRATICSFTRAFQYKIINNILYLSKKLFNFGKTNSPLCSFCSLKEETVLHIYSECLPLITLWENLQCFFSNDLRLPCLTPQTAGCLFRFSFRVRK